MQFRTVRQRQTGSDRFARALGPRGEFFAFECAVSHDPTIESVEVQLSPDVAGYVSREYWPGIQSGVCAGRDQMRAAGVHLCGTSLLILGTKEHPVDTSPRVVRERLAEFVRSRVVGWSEPIALRSEWLTSDVVAIARGIHASGAQDGLPALTDALLEAGCDDALVIEHLTTCPDHGPMCWVVEMIRTQAALRDGTSG
jgi:hypothetical protein